jgi:phosphatidylserine decarboxylase
MEQNWTGVMQGNRLAFVLPFLSFVMAAFSALRLAKFNLDERQALGFIGLPTPAHALFWGSLIAGAMARRIVTYAKEGEECYIDEHLGFIKLGSRVDVYLPLTAKACVTMGQPTTGDQTVIAKLK